MRARVRVRVRVKVRVRVRIRVGLVSCCALSSSCFEREAKSYRGCVRAYACGGRGQ